MDAPALPHAALVVDGVSLANYNVTETTYVGVYSTTVFLTAGSHQFRMEFTDF